VKVKRNLQDLLEIIKVRGVLQRIIIQLEQELQ